MRRLAMLILLASVLLMSGCVISSQIGERAHVNSPPPEEITFHFKTPFNTALLYGRTLFLLSAAVWVFTLRSKRSDAIVPIVLAVVLAAAAVWWFKIEWSKVYRYRIDVLPSQLHLRIPAQPELAVGWEQIAAIQVEGMARDLRFMPNQPFWSTEWKDLEIFLADGAKLDVDLRPLSVEQRGNLWRAIRRKAHLGDKIEYISES